MDDFHVGSIPFDPGRNQARPELRNRKRPQRSPQQATEEDDVVTLSEAEPADEPPVDFYSPSARRDE